MAEFDDQPMDMKLQPGINIIKGPELGVLKLRILSMCCHFLGLCGWKTVRRSRKSVARRARDTTRPQTVLHRQVGLCAGVQVEQGGL